MKRLFPFFLALILLTAAGCFASEKEAPTAADASPADPVAASQTETTTANPSETTAVSQTETTATTTAEPAISPATASMEQLAGLTVRQIAAIYGNDYIIECSWDEEAVFHYPDNRVPCVFHTGDLYRDGMTFSGDEKVMSLHYTVSDFNERFRVTDTVSTDMDFGAICQAFDPVVGYDTVYFARAYTEKADILWEFGSYYPRDGFVPTTIRVFPASDGYRYKPSGYDKVILDFAEKYSSEENLYGNYTYCDINGDGFLELIIEKGTCEADREYFFYTMSNGEPVPLGSYNAWHAGLFLNSNGEITIAAGFDGTDDYTTLRLEGTSLVTVKTGKIDMSETQNGAFGESVQLLTPY